MDTGFISLQQLAVIIKDKNLAVLHRVRFLDSHSNPPGRRVNIDAGQVSVAEATGFGQCLHVDAGFLLRMYAIL
ncbi:hypothetical protein D3C74_471550 [compost metagenome]